MMYDHEHGLHSVQHAGSARWHVTRIASHEGRRLSPAGCSMTTGQQSSGGGPRRASLEPDVQLNKWGFVPGGDDTLELNLMTKGAPSVSWLSDLGMRACSDTLQHSCNAGLLPDMHLQALIHDRATLTRIGYSLQP